MTGSTYLEFDKGLNKGFKLIKSGENPTFGLLVVCGINLGLRIQDLLKFTYGNLRNDYLIINEGKTGKKRKITFNKEIKRALESFKDEPDSFNCFMSQKGTIYSTQHVNRLIKAYFGNQFTSHSLRKSFGRRVYENNGESEKALMFLSELFNHTSISITRKYLGIRQEELDDIYLNL